MATHPRRGARVAPPARASRPRPAAAAPRPRRAMLRFVIGFVVVATGLFALYQVSEATRHFNVVNEGNALLSGAILKATGVSSERSGTTLLFERGGMQIISECSAIYVAILFMAGVLAFPTTWRARLVGLALGLPILFAVNVLRLVTLGAVIRYRPALLPLFHEYLWQVLFILIVAGLYLAWIERFVPRARSHQPA